MATSLSRLSRRLAGAACLVALLGGCAKSTAEAVAEHRPAVESVFGQLRALSDAAVTAPEFVEDAVALDGASIRLHDSEDAPSNAVFLFASDLAAPENATDEGLGGTFVSAIQQCGEALRDPEGAPAGAPLFLAECARTEYAVVLRTNEERAAEIEGSDRFSPGLYDGDVLVFRLADGALLGGFHVHAESSDEVQVLVDSAGAPIDPTERLHGDLDTSVFAEILAKLRTHLPGSVRD